MPTLFQWDLILRQGDPIGVGIISGHRRLQEGLNIHTSPILHAAMIKNGPQLVQLETASGNTYHLRMKEWSPRVDGEEPLDPALLDLPSDFCAQCAQAREEACRAEEAELRTLMEPNTLFMRVVGTHILSAFWADEDSRIQDVPVEIHFGIFQNSCLICGTNGKSGIDFRLYSMKNRLEPYHISQGIKSLYIRNEGCTDIAYGVPTGEIWCPFGAITSIPVQSRIV